MEIGAMTLNPTDRGETRRFGAMAFIFFGLLCATAVWRAKIFMAIIFGLLTAMGMVLTVIPEHARPLYIAWRRIAQFLGRVITSVVLIMAYYLVITPSGLLKRIVGGPPLPLNADKAAASYWISRDEPAQPKDRFLKRF